MTQKVQPEPAALDDEELVAAFLDAQDAECRAAFHESIVERFCGAMDDRIRAVLASRGLDYSPSSDYYNTVFFDVYERVLSPEGLRKKAAHFNLQRGKFRTWFLGAVVVNEVRDWLKRKNRPQGLLLGEMVSEETEFRLHRTQALDAFPAETSEDPREETVHPDTPDLIDDLSMEHRVVAHLLFLAYSDPPEEVVREIARLRDESPKQTESALLGLQHELRGGDQFHEAEKLERRVALEWERLEYFRLAAVRAEDRLVAAGASPAEIEGLKEKSSLQWKAVRSEQKELRRRFRNGEVRQEAWERAHLEHELITHTKRRREHKEHWQRLRNRLRGGSYLARLPNKKIAAFLGIPEGTVASRINALKKRFATEDDPDEKSY